MLEIVRVVPDDEQRSARGNRLRRPFQHQAALDCGNLEVENENEVERPVRQCIGDEIGLDPLDGDAPRRLRSRRASASATVEKSTPVDPPALLREPDRVAACAAGEIEREAGLDPGDRRDEEAVRETQVSA